MSSVNKMKNAKNANYINKNKNHPISYRTKEYKKTNVNENSICDKLLIYIYHIYSFFILFSPILVILDRFVKFSGTLLTGIPFVLGLLIIIFNKKHLFGYFLFLLLFLISCFINNDIINGFETFKPLIIFLLSLHLCEIDDFLFILKNNFMKFKKLIFLMLTVIVFSNLLFSFISLGYSSLDTETWGLDAYMGLYSSPHQAAYRFSSLLVYLVFMFFLSKNKLYSSTLIMITTVLLFKTGARTPTLIGLFIVLFLLYVNKKIIFKFAKEFINNYKIKAYFLIFIVSFIFLYCFFNSAFFQKIINLSFQTFDSGRAMLRNQELNYFMSCDYINKLFGNSLDIVYTVNQGVIGAKIWCHSDYMQILMQFGIIMLGLYILNCFMFFKNQYYNLKNKSEKILFYIIVLLFVFVSFYNGLFFFPRFTIVIPLMYIVFRKYINEVKI